MTELFNIEAEQQILGTLLSINEAIAHTERAGLRPYHFYQPQHRDIYSAFLSDYSEGKRITPVTLMDRFKNESNYMARLIGASTSVVNVFDYAATVVDLCMRRQLIECADSIKRDVNSKTSAEIASHASASIMAVTQANYTPTMRSSAQVTLDILEDLKRDVVPFKTGIASLDDCMEGGMYSGKAYGFAARKKVGKTILAATVSHNLNMTGVPHLFICGEMSAKEVHQRVISRQLDVFPSSFRTGFAESPHMLMKIAELHRETPSNTIYLDAPGITFDQLKQAVNTAYVSKGIKGFILDYWQLVGGKDPRESEASHLGQVAQWIADVCRKLDIWAFVLAQINQEGNTRGGEGLRLAFDQVYQIKAPQDDPSEQSRWVEMMDTRYTKWRNIGSEVNGGWMLNQRGLFFEDSQS